MNKLSRLWTTVLTAIAYLMAWFILFSVVLVVLFNIAGTVTVLASVYDNLRFIIIFYFLVCVLLVIFSIWFVNKYFKNG